MPEQSLDFDDNLYEVDIMSPRQWSVATALFLFMMGTHAASEGGGPYSVLLLANVDAITADTTMEKLSAAGYGNFVKTGSTANGFDVHMPGLSLQEARTIAAQVEEAIGFAPRAWETAKLP